MDKKKVYYSHTMLMYNSSIEEEDTKLLEKMGYEVINPNKKENEEEYLRTLNFDVFLRLVKQCDILAFRGIFGKISFGVKTEIDYARQLGLPIIELPTFTSDRFLSITETQNYCRPKTV